MPFHALLVYLKLFVSASSPCTSTCSLRTTCDLARVLLNSLVSSTAPMLCCTPRGKKPQLTIVACTFELANTIYFVCRILQNKSAFPHPLRFSPSFLDPPGIYYTEIDWQLHHQLNRQCLLMHVQPWGWTCLLFTTNQTHQRARGSPTLSSPNVVC